MQDPNTMTFAARASAKDEQIRSITAREQNETNLKKQLADEEAARASDEAYLVKLALADAVANQAILERYAHHLPPPVAPVPAKEAAPEAPATGSPVSDSGAADFGAAPVPGVVTDPASQPVS